MPLLVLSGAEYATISFHELHDRICDALRGSRPRVIAEALDTSGGSRLFFGEGSTRGKDDELSLLRFMT